MMRITKCKGCGTKIVTDGLYCPHCGAHPDSRAELEATAIAGGLLLLFVVLAVLFVLLLPAAGLR